MEASEYDNIARLEARHWWYVGMRAIAADVLRHAVAAARRGRLEILDAGCGTGGGMEWLVEFGAATGLDYHPRAVAYARRKSPRVCRGTIEGLPFAPGSFDLVTSFEVLYHGAVGDDVQALREMARVLRPGGWLLARVPAHDWLRGGHDRQVHTRHRYTRRELGAKLGEAGLAIVRLSYLGSWLLPAAVLARGLGHGRSRGRRGRQAAHSDVALPSPLANRVLTAMLGAERYWLRRWNVPFGLSVLALAGKPGGP